MGRNLVGRVVDAVQTGTEQKAVLFAQAAAALKKAAELDPGLADARFFLGMAYYQQGLYAEALPELEAFRKSAGRSLEAADLRKLDGVIDECRARK